MAILTTLHTGDSGACRWSGILRGGFEWGRSNPTTGTEISATKHTKVGHGLGGFVNTARQGRSHTSALPETEVREDVMAWPPRAGSLAVGYLAQVRAEVWGLFVSMRVQISAPFTQDQFRRPAVAVRHEDDVNVASFRKEIASGFRR